MNSNWRKKIVEFGDRFENKNLRGFTLMMSVYDFESDIRQENQEYINLEMPYENFSKKEAEELIDGYLNKAKALAFWEILIFGK